MHVRFIARGVYGPGSTYFEQKNYGFNHFNYRQAVKMLNWADELEQVLRYWVPPWRPSFVRPWLIVAGLVVDTRVGSETDRLWLSKSL